MTYDHLMVDVETLGLRPSSCILSVGVVPFTLKPGEEHVAARSLCEVGRATAHANLEEFRTVDGPTVEFWLRQPDDARRSLLMGPRHSSMDELRRWFLGYATDSELFPNADEVRVWSRGPDFDVAVLRDWLGDDYPFLYSAGRDCRTVDDLAEMAGVADRCRVASKVEHDALEDARAQAKTVVKTWRVVRENLGR